MHGRWTTEKRESHIKDDCSYKHQRVKNFDIHEQQLCIKKGNQDFKTELNNHTRNRFTSVPSTGNSFSAKPAVKLRILPTLSVPESSDKCPVQKTSPSPLSEEFAGFRTRLVGDGKTELENVLLATDE